MTVKPGPAQYPDIVMYEHALPITWKGTLRSEGVAIDITDSEVLVPVLDDGEEVTSLPFEKTDPEVGEIKLTINQAVYDAVGRYSTWRLFETDHFDYPPVQGRLVKA
jgi:hypothetical protein